MTEAGLQGARRYRTPRRKTDLPEVASATRLTGASHYFSPEKPDFYSGRVAARATTDARLLNFPRPDCLGAIAARAGMLGYERSQISRDTSNDSASARRPMDCSHRCGRRNAKTPANAGSSAGRAWMQIVRKMVPRDGMLLIRHYIENTDVFLESPHGTRRYTRNFYREHRSSVLLDEGDTMGCGLPDPLSRLALMCAALDQFVRNRQGIQE
jgi:hypothetical protein